ncbi:MAG: threonine/serine exporter family protein [Marvinbryantia sp.]|uniref:threonine/serine exporter family protein n=1 Tax=Marvinbryantia sp. TaxID=2496532 RepID=UPI0025FB5305|nr:threonine/serine exporter family protein [uncultured Marvinbryantia sp.]
MENQLTDYKLLLDTAVLAGQIMLSSGAEIYRVEDTIHRILSVSGLKSAEAYVTATGLIVTLDNPDMDSMTVVKRIRNRDTNLNRIAKTNEISRRFCAGEMSLKEAFSGLKHMEMHTYALWQKNIAIVVVAAAFSILLGGTVADGIAAGVTGVVLAAVLLLCGKLQLNAFMENMLCALMIGVTALLLQAVCYPPLDVDMVIVGGIMPIVPGAALTTAVRDTLQGDYVAGGAKILEALLKAAAIVIGAGAATLLMRGVGIC